MSKLILYGFDGSTYVRTVRTLLAAKGAEYEQVPVNVLEGEPLQPDHLARHPFGKVPVIDHGDLRLIETGAITRYLNDVLDGPSFVPDNPVDRARMDMAISMFDSYGYLNLVTVPGYHLFRDLVGNPDEKALQEAIDASRLVLTEIMKVRGDSPWIAGDKPSLADFYLGPACFYISLVDESKQVFDVPGFDAWWTRMQQYDHFKVTEPNLG